jgi:hypothetical protein
MIAHVDKKIVIEAFREYRKDIVGNSDTFIKFLAKGADLNLYGEQSLEDSNILSRFLQNREGTRIADFDTSFNTVKHSIDSNNPYQVFFLNEVDQNKQFEHKKAFADFFCGFINDYQTQFEKLAVKKSLALDSKGSENALGWSQILPHHPVTDFIICDRYIYNLENGNHSLKSFRQLLFAINERYKIKNLLLFIGKSGLPEMQYDELIEEIVKESNKILGDSTQVFLIFIEKSNEDHDRYFLMNYCRIEMGSSINSFDDTLGILTSKKRTKIRVESYVNPDKFEDSKKDLSFLKENLEKAKEHSPNFPKWANSNLFNIS